MTAPAPTDETMPSVAPAEQPDEQQPHAGHAPRPRVLNANLTSIALTGTLLWTVALVVTLLVPAWHSDDQDWWPQTCAVGIVLGVLGYFAARRTTGT